MLELSKGQKLDLNKDDGTALSQLTATVNWEAGSVESDVDVSVVLLNADGKRLPDNDGLLYYNTLSHGHAGLVHSGDDRSGGTGETINVNLDEVNDSVSRLVVVVTSYNQSKVVNFGQISIPTVTIADDNGVELFHFELDEDASTATALNCGEIYRRNGSWKFEASGKVLGSSINGLEDVLAAYPEA